MLQQLELPLGQVGKATGDFEFHAGVDDDQAIRLRETSRRALSMSATAPSSMTTCLTDNKMQRLRPRCLFISSCSLIRSRTHTQ